MGWLASCPRIFMGLALVHFQIYWLLRHLQCLVKKSKNQQNINTSKIWVLKSMINVIGGSSKARLEKLDMKWIKESLFATIHQWLDHLKKTILSYGEICHNIWQNSILEEKIIFNPSWCGEIYFIYRSKNHETDTFCNFF